MAEAPRMSSNRPYLLRALYEWINDNDLTPYILVDARQPGVQVPTSAIKDGKVVLNIAMRAVEALDLGNDGLSFRARFGGVSQYLYVPVAAVIAIYAHETGQGMMLPPDESAPEDTDAALAEQAVAKAETDDGGDGPPPPPKGGHLRIVK